MFGFSSGSSNSGYESSRSSDGPPSNVFSHETLRSIIDQATNSGRLSQSDADAIRKSSNNAIPRSSGRRTHSHSGHHQSEKSASGCDCCRPGYDTPPSSSHGPIGSVRTDANGDRIEEWDQSEAPGLRIHRPATPPSEGETGGQYRRKSNGGRKQSSSSVSSGSSSGSSRSHSDYGRNHRVTTNAEGDEEVEWAGESGDLRIRAHCPDSPPLAPRRTSTSGSSKSSSSSGKRTNSSRSAKDFRRSNSNHQQLGF